ncbi:10681_t:CDS:2 [Rhizophagus irregularis]|nr:10681_t:CDS:2 [Rhizophagus irregularis]
MKNTTKVLMFLNQNGVANKTSDATTAGSEDYQYHSKTARTGQIFHSNKKHEQNVQRFENFRPFE